MDVKQHFPDTLHECFSPNTVQPDNMVNNIEIKGTFTRQRFNKN